MKILEFQKFIVESFDRFWADTALEHANLTIDKVDLDEWVRLSIVYGPSKAINLAMGAKRSGSIYLQVFTKSDIGQGRATELAVKAGEFLSSLSLQGLDLYPYELMVLGNKATAGLTTTETSWFQINCIVDFVFID